MKKISFCAEYLASPLFDNQQECMGHIEIDDIGVSKQLAMKIFEWDKEFQETFDESYPPDSGFKNKQDERRHQEEGRKLAEELQEELGDGYLVEYRY